jgi:hypothetical protein
VAVGTEHLVSRTRVGFRTRISGGRTSCIYDDRVGLGHPAKLDALTFDNWLDAIRVGRSYVSDGRSHLMDTAVNGGPAADGEIERRSCEGDVECAAGLDEKPVGERRRPADRSHMEWSGRASGDRATCRWSS